MSRKLHLHARSIAIPHPSGQAVLRVSAELPDHMRETWELFGFETGGNPDPFPQD